jgi:c-di-GMP-binding flagellar brake protein YcgR
MDPKTGWVEKRQHERVVATLKVDYRIVDSKESKKILENPNYRDTTAEQMPYLSQQSQLYHVVTRDISLGGMALLGEEPFPKGAMVEIGLHLPKYQTVLKFLSQVMHTESFTEMGRTIYRAGVQFMAVNQGDLDRIKEFLISQQKKQGS